jgi:hypothetical protein
MFRGTEVAALVVKPGIRVTFATPAKVEMTPSLTLRITKFIESAMKRAPSEEPKSCMGECKTADVAGPPFPPKPDIYTEPATAEIIPPLILRITLPPLSDK